VDDQIMRAGLQIQPCRHRRDPRLEIWPQIAGKPVTTAGAVNLLLTAASLS
jgi:hypothetical protein